MGFYLGNTNISGIYVGDTEISGAYVGAVSVYENAPMPDYLKFTAKTNNSSIRLFKKSSTHTIQYSKDGNNWSSMTAATRISLASGESVYLRGVLSGDNTSTNYTRFAMTGNIKASGNMNYLWDYNNPSSELQLKADCGYFMFNECTALKDASELKLPSTKLAQWCYYSMFAGCSNLTTVSADLLPATTLADYCYTRMFVGCTSLTTAPELLAPTVAPYGYYTMFSGCTSLNYIKCLATDISASASTTNWVTNVASAGTFVKNSDMSDWTTGNNGIPSGWTIENYVELVE